MTRRFPVKQMRNLLRLSAALVAAPVLLALLGGAGQSHAQEQPATPPQPAQDAAASESATAATQANADWPCVQHKQPVLTAAQMWDGPQIASEGARSQDHDITRLVAIVVSRRLSMDEVEKDIKAFADALPEDKRDAKLAELFSAVLAETNTTRASVVSGIEKFQRRQNLRSHKLEVDGAKLAELVKASEADVKDQEAARLAQEAQSSYDWDARVFQERQQNMPIACEIPVLIEQRAFAIAQAIRNLMEN